MMKLNNSSLKPLYIQVMDAIKKNINDGSYAIGAQLPAEPELCEMFGVSRITTRRAIMEMVEEGILQKLHGKGTFVTNNKLKRELIAVNGFTDFLLESGKNPQTRILSKKVIKASKRQSEALAVDRDAPLYEFIRLHLVGDEPIHLENSYYSLEKFPDLDQHVQESTSTYRILKEVYGIQAVRNIKSLNVSSPTTEEASLLNCTQDTPLFDLEKIAYDQDGIPIHYTVSLLPTNKVSFSITS